MQVNYYYRLNGLGIDNWSVKEVKKYNRVLLDFDNLSAQFNLLKESFESQNKNRADIFVCVCPGEADAYLNSVVEISVYHKITRKLFSRAIKKNCFSLCLSMGPPNEPIKLYSYETTNLEEVKQIFQDYVINQRIPNIHTWRQFFSSDESIQSQYFLNRNSKFL